MSKTKSKNSETVVIKGILKYLGRGITKYDRESKYRISIEAESLDRTLFDSAYKNNKFTPDWYTNTSKNSITLKTKYDIPVQYESHNHTLDDLIVDGRILDAKVRISINIKDNAIYPKALIVDEMGEKYDPFADFK